MGFSLSHAATVTVSSARTSGRTGTGRRLSMQMRAAVVTMGPVVLCVESKMRSLLREGVEL